jgi:hypothetical protein
VDIRILARCHKADKIAVAADRAAVAASALAAAAAVPALLREVHLAPERYSDQLVAREAVDLARFDRPLVSTHRCLRVQVMVLVQALLERRSEGAAARAWIADPARTQR